MAKNLAKLVKKVITNKNGKKTTVWVKMGDAQNQPKSKEKKEDKLPENVTKYNKDGIVGYRTPMQVFEPYEGGGESKSYIVVDNLGKKSKVLKVHLEPSEKKLYGGAFKVGREFNFKDFLGEE